MIRKSLTILSLIGLLLSVGLWSASYWIFAYFNPQVSIHAFEGCVYLRMWDQEQYDFATLKSEMNSFGFRSVSIGNNLFAVQTFQGWRTSFWLGEIVPSAAATTAAFPLWIPTLTFALLPAYALLPYHRRRKRKKLGLCLQCGYDLRGSSGRCPECGEAFDRIAP